MDSITQDLQKPSFHAYAKRLEYGGTETVGEVRKVFSVTVACEDPHLRGIIGKRIVEFLNADDEFCTAYQDIADGKVLRGKPLIEFLVEESLANDPRNAKNMISRGSVLRKVEGSWKVVGNTEATMLPGWWKVFKRGWVHIGADFIVEKRIKADSGYTNWKGKRKGLRDMVGLT